MSQHKTGRSNWSPEQKELYRKRREHGVRGEPGFVNVHAAIRDEQGHEQRVPLGHLRGRGRSTRSMGKTRTSRRAALRQIMRKGSRGA